MHASPGFVPPPDLRAHLPMVGQGLLKMSCLSGVYVKDSFRVDSVINPCFETCPRRHPKQQKSTRVRSGTSFEDRSVFFFFFFFFFSREVQVPLKPNMNTGINRAIVLPI